MATTKSLDAGMDSLDMFTAKGKMPGYLGFVPGMRNHVIGKRYAEATLRAGDCTGMLRSGLNPSGNASLVDDRPQGRQFLYAQMATPIRDEPALAPPHVGKRKPLLDSATTGQIDPRLMPKVVGGHGDERGPVKTVKTATMPSLPYGSKRFIMRKEYPEKPPDMGSDVTKAMMPGYTGHQAASQHVFAQSYGKITQALNENIDDTPVDKSRKFISYGEERPGNARFSYETNMIPGYQGHIPAKDTYIYGRTYGTSAGLAKEAREKMEAGKSPAMLHNLVDIRPTGRVDLYAESQIVHHEANPTPLLCHLGKGVAQPKFRFTTNDYKIRERYNDDVLDVMQGKHNVVGYTGHVRGEQHVYSQGYGRMTRLLNDAKHSDSLDALVDFVDDRPQYK